MCCKEIFNDFHFWKEITVLRKELPCQKQVVFFYFSPFLNISAMLCAGRRLKNSNFSFRIGFLIIFPAKYNATNLVINDCYLWQIGSHVKFLYPLPSFKLPKWYWIFKCSPLYHLFTLSRFTGTKLYWNSHEPVIQVAVNAKINLTIMKTMDFLFKPLNSSVKMV